MMSKEVVPFNTSITDLISKAPDSPPFFQLRNSINYLKVEFEYNFSFNLIKY